MPDEKVNAPTRPRKNQPAMVPGAQGPAPEPELKPGYPDFEGKLHPTFSDAHNSNLAIKAKK